MLKCVESISLADSGHVERISGALKCGRRTCGFYLKIGAQQCVTKPRLQS